MKYQEKVLGVFELTDLDLDYYYSNELDENGDRVRLEIKTSDEVYFGECPPAKIDDVIDYLTQLKNMGSDMVYIGEHIDHHGYYFYGIKLEEYVPTKQTAWKSIKDFPNGSLGQIYLFDEKQNKFYYIKWGRPEYVSFMDFHKYPEFFEKIEVEI